MKALELKGVMLLHVFIRDPEFAVCFGAVNESAVNILVSTFFIDFNVWCILPSLRILTLWRSTAVHICAISRKSKTSPSSVVTSDVLTVT